jgi:hypothetical protein
MMCSESSCMSKTELVRPLQQTWCGCAVEGLMRMGRGQNFAMKICSWWRLIEVD